jgi:hypothetical protein
MPLHNLHSIDKYCQTALQLIDFYIQEWRQYKLALFNKCLIYCPGLDNYRSRPLIGQEKLSKQPEPALNDDSIACA